MFIVSDSTNAIIVARNAAYTNGFTAFCRLSKISSRITKSKKTNCVICTIISEIMAQFAIVRLDPSARLPTRGTPQSAGYDLYAPDDTLIVARGSVLINLHIAMSIPMYHVGIIKSRSSLASKFGVCVDTGVIDSDYRGSIKVLLFNHSDKDYQITAGDRIAQLLILKYLVTPFQEVKEFTEETERGERGFGSTGK